MARKRKGQDVNGWVNLDKPLGMTSTQAVSIVRRLFDAKKAGHAGTLDPLATGILPIALGEATKTIPYVQDALKIYSFTIAWGEERDTHDAEGKIVATSAIRPSENTILAALPAYIGDIQQTPPRFSAIKIDGQRAYDLARAGEEVELKPRPVYIERIDLIEALPESADFEMLCGKGTYVRALSRDLSAALGTCGYISALRREAVGPFAAEDAIPLDILREMHDSAALDRALLPLETALDDIPALALKDGEPDRLRNGKVLAFISRPDYARLEKAGLAHENLKGTTDALAVYAGMPVALVEIKGPEVRPVRVFNL